MDWSCCRQPLIIIQFISRFVVSWTTSSTDVILVLCLSLNMVHFWLGRKSWCDGCWGKLSNLCCPIQCVAYREEQTAIVGIFKNVSIIYRVCKPQYAAISRDTPKTYHSKEIRYIWFSFFLETIASCTTHMNLLQKKYEQFTILITMHLRNAPMAKLLTLWPLPILFTCPICNFRASKQPQQPR